MLHSRLLQPAFGVHGVNNLYELAKEITRFEISPVAAQNISKSNCRLMASWQRAFTIRHSQTASLGSLSGDGHAEFSDLRAESLP